MFSQRRKWYQGFLGIIVLSVIGIGILLLGWAGTDYALKKTSGPEFCGSCHSMRPMLASFLADTHGGNNAMGMQAQCADCHLPQDNYFNYLYTKVTTSAYDIWLETTGKSKEIDWHAKRANAFSFTYDSGCLKCHNNLQEYPLDDSGKPQHADYFAPDANGRCLTCHNVGHKGLEALLPPRP